MGDAAKVIVTTPEELQRMIDHAVSAALAKAREPENDSPHMTLGEAAERLKCSERTVRRFIARGKLVAAKVEDGCSRVLVTRESLDHLLSVSTKLPDL